MNNNKNIYILYNLLIFLLITNCSNFESIDSNPYNIKISFKESLETLKNPGIGYTHTYWLKAEKNKVKYQNHIGSTVLMFIDIGAYSSGVNGEGKDYDLDSSFFESLRKNFEICRNNGGTIALRFRYDSNGIDNPEPETFGKILEHINQIKESGLLEEYKDIIMFVESGFVGKWGEQHGGKYCSLENKAQILDVLLDIIPDNIPVTVRTPNTIAKWLNISEDKLDTFIAEKGSKASRVGLYNDGYMGSDSDLGTYRYRNSSINFFYNQMRYTYYGGEFSGNIEFAMKYDTYKPENCIKEMYKSHLSYINGNIFSLYKNYTFGKIYDVENVDNSAYYGQNVFKFIRDHLGYRLVLRKSDIQKEVRQGEIFYIKIEIENTGFANPIRKMNSELILEKNGHYISTELDVDATEFYSCYMRSIQFANNGIYESNLGANYIGKIEITKLKDKTVLNDRTFFQYNSKKDNMTKSDYKLYNINKIIKLDGLKSLYEWTEDLLIGKDDENRKLYATNDDKYLYVMAEIKHNSTSPVANIRIVHGQKRYWFYYASNGGIYFSESNYDNWLYMNNGFNYEFKIPLADIMKMHYGTNLTSIVVFIQDMSIDGWPGRGTISSSKEYIIKYNYNIFTAFKNVTLNKGQNYSLDVDVSLNYTNIHWIFNNSYINGAIKPSYQIKNVEEKNEGIYSVNISSENGSKIIDICEVQLYKEKGTNRRKTNVLIGVIATCIVILLVSAVCIYLKFFKKNSVDKEIEDLEKQKNQKLY